MKTEELKKVIDNQIELLFDASKEANNKKDFCYLCELTDKITSLLYWRRNIDTNNIVVAEKDE